jgi:hypothetical protein
MSGIAVREPFLRTLSPNVKLFFGFKDGRGELKVKTPIAIVVPVTIPPEKIPLIKKAFDEAYPWALKSEAERKDGKGDIERVLDDRAKVVFGFPDGSVKICVRPIKLSPWIPVTLSREELLEGKPAMDEVNMWLELPKEVRDLQGVL